MLMNFALGLVVLALLLLWQKVETLSEALVIARSRVDDAQDDIWNIKVRLDNEEANTGEAIYNHKAHHRAIVFMHQGLTSLLERVETIEARIDVAEVIATLARAAAQWVAAEQEAQEEQSEGAPPAGGLKLLTYDPS